MQKQNLFQEFWQSWLSGSEKEALQILVEMRKLSFQIFGDPFKIEFLFFSSPFKFQIFSFSKQNFRPMVFISIFKQNFSLAVLLIFKAELWFICSTFNFQSRTSVLWQFFQFSKQNFGSLAILSIFKAELRFFGSPYNFQSRLSAFNFQSRTSELWWK